MRTLYIFLIFSVFYFDSFSQVSGYLGKRSYLLFDITPTTATFASTPSGKTNYINLSMIPESEIDYSIFAMNFKPEVSFSYLIRNDIALGVSGAYNITSTYIENEFQSSYKEYGIIKGIGAGIYVQIFSGPKESNIAPMGRYITLGVDLIMSDLYSNVDDATKLNSKKILSPILTYEFGKQILLNDWLLLKYGASINVNIGLLAEVASMSYETNDGYTLEDANQSSVQLGIQLYQMVNFHLALGTIAF
ncbi:hypothetical protein OO013_09355 [Mangrovivirga sp. M17]|uniref:Outer membrane protein beta-barrel domain-containing protein n=1 Tax=Mangrovivirga halotolerans TaxID=2993936 RepID=A0ABT3RQK3_9BACT|nr:hypothetical protein [Mangrovivirga halotolerans]MCX2744071.1 hypothetical protein [Mangrovivirga halotolerans]